MVKRIAKRPELMAPAGDFVCLEAALKAGADAIYFGIRGGNMRAGARNFALRDLPKIVSKCKESGAKAYLALNTIYFESEISLLGRVCEHSAKAGVDAVIAWDFAAVSEAKKANLPVFLSTQASVANSEAMVCLAEKFGIKRFVLARECSISDLKKIRKVLDKRGMDVELEVFVHGAMCVSESGRCFLSQFSRGKSANRGECLQPCRKTYIIKERSESGAEFELGESTILSPKDLCALPFLEKLVEAGADSLKIEGRNRNAEYVFETTSSYKKVLDFYMDFAAKGKTERNPEEFENLKKSECERLKKVFNRGFSGGFFMGKPVGNWTSDISGGTEKKFILGHVVKYYPKMGVAEMAIDSGSLKEGDFIQIEGKNPSKDPRFFRSKISEIRVGGLRSKFAKKGDCATVSVPEKVRLGDRVFVFKKA